ncbi:MAG: hypothetical protein ABL970_12815 [Nitrospira sp.]
MTPAPTLLYVSYGNHVAEMVLLNGVPIYQVHSRQHPSQASALCKALQRSLQLPAFQHVQITGDELPVKTWSFEALTSLTLERSRSLTTTTSPQNVLLFPSSPDSTIKTWLVPVAIQELIDGSFDEFLDLVADRVGKPLLSDITYTATSVLDEGTILFQVSGEDAA